MKLSLLSPPPIPCTLNFTEIYTILSRKSIGSEGILTWKISGLKYPQNAKICLELFYVIS